MTIITNERINMTRSKKNDYVLIDKEVDEELHGKDCLKGETP